MYLISLYFDDKTNVMISRYIDKIAKCTGNTFMTENNVPPHLTISSVEARSGEVLMKDFESLKCKLQMGKIQFVSVGMFLPYVIYMTPVLNEYLQDISSQIYDTVKSISETRISRFYKPMQWFPHVTLGKKLDKMQMRTAFEIMQESFQPVEADVVAVGLAKTNPHKDLMRFRLDTELDK